MVDTLGAGIRLAKATDGLQTQRAVPLGTLRQRTTPAPTMAIRKIQVSAWLKLSDAGDPSMKDFMKGPSPGGAAAELGISRQAVHNAIHAGKLEALAVYDGKRLSHYTISSSSLAAYREELRSRAKADIQRLMARM